MASPSLKSWLYATACMYVQDQAYLILYIPAHESAQESYVDYSHDVSYDFCSL